MVQRFFAYLFVQITSVGNEVKHANQHREKITTEVVIGVRYSEYAMKTVVGDVRISSVQRHN